MMAKRKIIAPVTPKKSSRFRGKSMHTRQRAGVKGRLATRRVSPVR